VTEQKNLEAQFLRTQRMNTIGTLAGGMAHDLNNALAPVLLGTQLLRRRATDEESRNLLGLMETSTHRGAEMVRQVLLFARGRGGEFERLVLPPLVKELEKLVKETFPRNITVERFLPEDLWPVRGNPTQLHQVLLNLCVNARDAMPDGGKLSFMADNIRLDAIEAETIPEGRAGEFVSLSVSDTGTGMPPEVRARIFEPFYTTKGEGRGTGIGLSTVMRILRSHQGFLRVESEPGEGTTFELFLPRTVDAGDMADLDQPIETPRGQGELILVVDDERAICELVSDGLASHGYRVLTAADGDEAASLLQEHRNEVRLVITDGSMPVMDGVQTMVALRRMKPGLPMIYSSADADPENADIKDASAFLRKPYSLEELLAAVHRCMA
jgi:two-component system, cell cycle sensor histidine kinase and response regulator CckA